MFFYLFPCFLVKCFFIFGEVFLCFFMFLIFCWSPTSHTFELFFPQQVATFLSVCRPKHRVWSEKIQRKSQNLVPKTTTFKWMFGERTIFHVMIWSHLTETTILKWMLRVPGSYWYLTLLCVFPRFPYWFPESCFCLSDLGAGHCPHGYVVELLGQPEITNKGLVWNSLLLSRKYTSKVYAQSKRNKTRFVVDAHVWRCLILFMIFRGECPDDSPQGYTITMGHDLWLMTWHISTYGAG